MAFTIAAHVQVFQATEAETASSVAYDTPSPKLLGFLRKHYGALLTQILRLYSDTAGHLSFQCRHSG